MKTLSNQLIIFTLSLFFINSAFAQDQSPCYYRNPVACVTLAVTNVRPPQGYYVKYAFNGQSIQGLPTATCNSDGSGFTMDSNDAKRAVEAGYLKPGENKIVITQCSDANCSSEGPSYTYQFTLSESDGTYTGNPNIYSATLKPFGAVCSVSREPSSELIK